MRGRDFIESYEGVGGGEALRCYCYRHIIGDVVHYRSIRHHVLLTIIMTAIMANVGLHMGLSHNVYIQCDISLPSLHVYRTLEWCCQSMMLCAWNVRHLLFVEGQFYHLEEIHEKGHCV